MHSKLVLTASLVLSASLPIYAGCIPQARDLVNAGSAALQRRDEDLCANAPNCEMHTTSYGARKARFIEGMGPGSAWYKEHVESTVANATVNTAAFFEDRKLGKRQGPNCGQEICSDWSASENKELFGTTNARTAVDSLYEQCAPTSCDVVIELDTFVIRGDGNGYDPGVIRITPDGRYLQEDRHILIYGITDIMGALQESMDTGERWDDHWKGPKYININCYTNGVLNGGLSVFIEPIVQDSRDCGGVLELIGAAASNVIPSAGLFFGAIAPVCDGIVGGA